MRATGGPGGEGKRLPGQTTATRIAVERGWFALGLSSDKADKFQGFHSRNLLIILDEASGVPDDIWDACEGIAVGENNRILAIGNPLACSGRFYRTFTRGPNWIKRTISALQHPNITGTGPPIHGAVTTTYLEDRIADWCEPIDPAFLTSPGSLESLPSVRGSPTKVPPGNASEGRLAEGPPAGGFIPPEHTPDTFTYKGRSFRPNNLFRIRVLGQFPNADDESLIPLRWIEAAMERKLPAKGYRKAAADIARFGDDKTVIGFRVGPVVEFINVIEGIDTMQVAGRISQLAYEHHPEVIAVDSIGIGAGVVDRLIELGLEGLDPINVSLPARDTARFANRRAELYWGLRESFRTGDISLQRDESVSEELACIRYRITSKGQIQIESKDEMKRRLGSSPDRADMLALLMEGAGVTFAEWRPHSGHCLPPSPAEQMRNEMRHW